MNKFFQEIKQVKWLSGRQLAVDATFILVFSGVLLAYFTLVDGALGQILKKLVDSL